MTAGRATRPAAPARSAQAISPLSRPDLSNARCAVENLLKLADQQKVDEKLRSQRLAAAIKGLFTADFRIQQLIKNAEPQEANIKRLQRSADDWMTPNSFGAVNEMAARDALAKADAIKTKLANQLGEKQQKLSANHGNSGGPVVDETGKVIGILTFGLGDLKIDRFNFAIRGEVAQVFIDEKLPK